MESVKTTAIVLFLIGCASAFGWMITYLQIPCGGDEVFSRTHFEQISYFIDRKYSSAFFGNGHGRGASYRHCHPGSASGCKGGGHERDHLRNSSHAQPRNRPDQSACRREPLRWLHGRQDNDRKDKPSHAAALACDAYRALSGNLPALVHRIPAEYLHEVMIM